MWLLVSNSVRRADQRRIFNIQTQKKSVRIRYRITFGPFICRHSNEQQHNKQTLLTTINALRWWLRCSERLPSASNAMHLSFLFIPIWMWRDAKAPENKYNPIAHIPNVYWKYIQNGNALVTPTNLSLFYNTLKWIFFSLSSIWIFVRCCFFLRRLLKTANLLNVYVYIFIRLFRLTTVQYLFIILPIKWPLHMNE